MHPRPQTQLPHTPGPRPTMPSAASFLYINAEQADTAWCVIVHSPDGDNIATGTTPKDPAASDDKNINAAAFAALEQLLTTLAPNTLLDLYVYNPSVRCNLAALSNSLKNIRLASTIHTGDLETAKQLIGPAPQAGTPQPEPAIMDEALCAGQTPILIATDASKRTKGRHVGMGWVIDQGNGNSPTLGSAAGKASDIHCAELMAIEKAVMWARENGIPTSQRIRIESDSRTAINALTGRSSRTSLTTNQRLVLSRILQLTAGANYEFAWVKGHADNPMNIIADNLAVAARRNAEMGIPEDAQQQILGSIGARAKAMLSGTRAIAA